MPIPIIEKGDLNELAWLLKEAFNIAKQQDIHNANTELIKPTKSRDGSEPPATIHEAMNAIMKTIAHTQAERTRSA